MHFENTRARKITPKGMETKNRILTAAAKLFAENGFEITSLAKISEAAGAPVGSITHLCGDKAGLAKLIYAEAMDRLATAVRRAVDQHPTDIERTVTRIIANCIAWAGENPYDGPLLHVLGECARPDEINGRHAQIESILTEWAQPLISARLIVSLTCTQLYAVMMAPVLSAVVEFPSMPGSLSAPDVAWTTILVNAALAAIVPARQKSPAAKAMPGIAENKAAAVMSGSPAEQGRLL